MKVIWFVPCGADKLPLPETNETEIRIRQKQFHYEKHPYNNNVPNLVAPFWLRQEGQGIWRLG
jgi:hypothetical protein